MVARSLSLNDNDEITGLSRDFRQNRNILRATTGRPYEQIRKSNSSINRNLTVCRKEKSPHVGGFDNRTQNARRHICSEKGKRRTVPKSVLVFDHSSSSDSGPRICGLLGSLQWLTGVAFHCPSTAAWYRWDVPIPKHCDLSCILPHLHRKCNGFYWFYLNSAMIDGKIEISFSISSSVVSWQREMRTEPSMRVGSTPIASNT